MAKKKKEEKKEEEKHFTPSNSLIECTGCPCGISNLISTTPTVFVKKQPMATIKDGLPASFLPFPTCSLSLTNTCVPAPIGEWETQGELEKIDIERQTPIIEGNRIKCQAQTGIGTITISEKTSTPPPPENAVDKAQNKINKAANSVTKKITEVAQDAKDAIGSIATTAKEAGGFLNNESVQGAISNASDLVDGVDRKKAEVDVAVGNINIRLENLRAELTQLITGQQQELRDLMTVEDRTPDQNQQEDQEQDEEEARYNQDFFDASNQSTVNDFMSEIENDIATLESSAADLHPPNDFETNTAPDSSTRYFTSEPPGNSDVGNTNSANNISTSNSITSTNSSRENLEEIIRNQEESNTHYQNTANSNYTEANNTLSSYGADPLPQDEESLQALALLNRFTGPAPETDPSAVILNAIPSSTAINTVSGSLETRINEERTSLNASVQSEIDEVLQEIDYFENLQEYQEESAELQEDLDRSSAALDILGDFDAFIDGIAAKHLGKLGDKYKKTMDQLGKNMSRLNDSLRGASFMAGGFKAGDVVTHAPDLPKEKEEEKEEDTAIAVLPPPTTSSGAGGGGEEKEEETPEETDECTFTKLTVIKNKTLEYVVIEKEEDNVILNQPINEPITFVAGTRESTKKSFEIQIKNLKRTEEHKEEQLFYQVDEETEEVDFPDGELVKIPIDIKYNAIFFEGTRLLSKLMGYFGKIPFTKYHIPINLCGFQKTINLNVYPDAEWGFALTVESDDPLVQSYASLSPGEVWKAQTKKADEIGVMNSDPISEGKRKAKFKAAYYVQYNNGKDKSQIDLSVINKIYKVSKSLFSAVKRVDELLDQLTRNQSLHSQASAVKIVIIPPAAYVGMKHKFSPSKSNSIFGDKESEFAMDVKLDPFLAANIELDMVQVAQRVPWVYALIKAVEKLAKKPVNEVFKFNITLGFKVSAGGTITTTSQEFDITSSVALGLELEINLEKKSGFFGLWGVTYKATAGATATSGVQATAIVGKDNDGVYAQGKFHFTGFVITAYIKMSISGTEEEQGEEDFKSFFELSKEWKGEFAGYSEAKATDKYYFIKNEGESSSESGFGGGGSSGGGGGGGW